MKGNNNKKALKKLPGITIITTVFNGISSLEKTIQSVLNLSYPEIDYIIIDGASKDGTIDIIKKYQHKLNFWVSEPDRGIYDAMNKGWAKAKNENYIIFLGSGDTIIQLPDMSSAENFDIIYGKVSIGDKYIFRSKVDFRLKLINSVHHQGELIRKSINLPPPFSLNYPVFADFDFNQKLYKSNFKFKRDNNFLSYALEGGISSRTDKKEMLAIVKKNFGFFYFFLARIYYALLDYKNSKKSYQ